VSKLTSALLKAEFLDVTGMEERDVDAYRRIPIKYNEKMALSISHNIICVVDAHGHTWIRPNIFSKSIQESCLDGIKKILRTNKECEVPFKHDNNRFLRQVWPHLFY